MLSEEFLKFLSILNEGERISERQAIELSKINEFFSKEVLTIIQYDVIDCVDPKDNEFSQLSINERECRNVIKVNPETNFILCQFCGKKSNLNNKNPYTERRLAINDRKLDLVLSNVLKNHNFKLTQTGTWEKTDIKIKFISRKRSNFPITFVSDKIGYLLNEHKNTDIEFWYQSVWEFLFCSDEQRESWFDGIVATFDKSLFPNEGEIERYLKNSLDGKHYTVFEKWYSDFLNKIGGDPERFKLALNYLEKTRNSLLGAVTIRIGENLEADTKTFPKFDYYKTILSSIQVGDTKLYSDGSRITLDHFRQLRDYADEEKGAIISLSDDVISSVWSRIFFYKDKRGRWDFVIITRTMLKELISLFLPSILET